MVKEVREPACSLCAPDFESGRVPTIVWEVGHTQSRSMLARRAKLWFRMFDGQTRVVITVKFREQNPREDNSAVLTVFRPRLRKNGTWTTTQEGPAYELFPRPATAVRGVYDSPADSIPLTYQDYFGPGNNGCAANGLPVDPETRFDIPLEIVREGIEFSTSSAARRTYFRYDAELVTDHDDDDAESLPEGPSSLLNSVDESTSGWRRTFPSEYDDFDMNWMDALAEFSDRD